MRAGFVALILFAGALFGEDPVWRFQAKVEDVAVELGRSRGSNAFLSGPSNVWGRGLEATVAGEIAWGVLHGGLGVRFRHLDLVSFDSAGNVLTSLTRGTNDLQFTPSLGIHAGPLSAWVESRIPLSSEVSNDLTNAAFWDLSAPVLPTFRLSLQPKLGTLPVHLLAGVGWNPAGTNHRLLAEAGIQVDLTYYVRFSAEARLWTDGIQTTNQIPRLTWNGGDAPAFFGFRFLYRFVPEWSAFAALSRSLPPIGGHAATRVEIGAVWSPKRREAP